MNDHDPQRRQVTTPRGGNQADDPYPFHARPTAGPPSSHATRDGTRAATDAVVVRAAAKPRPIPARTAEQDGRAAQTAQIAADPHWYPPSPKARIPMLDKGKHR